MKMRKQFGAICVVTSLLAGMVSTYSASAATTYSDVPQDHWAKPYVDFMDEQGYIKGYEDGTFGPGLNIKRAEVAAVMNRVFQHTALTDKVMPDVPADSWYATDMSKAVAIGYISGYEDGTYGPERNITRQEMAAMVFRSYNFEPIVHDNNFTDKDNVAPWANDAIATLANRQIITGYEDGSFDPEKNITRAEATKMLWAAIYVQQHPGTTAPPSVTPAPSTAPDGGHLSVGGGGTGGGGNNGGGNGSHSTPRPTTKPSSSPAPTPTTAPAGDFDDFLNEKNYEASVKQNTNDFFNYLWGEGTAANGIQDALQVSVDYLNEKDNKDLVIAGTDNEAYEGKELVYNPLYKDIVEAVKAANIFEGLKDDKEKTALYTATMVELVDMTGQEIISYYSQQEETPTTEAMYLHFAQYFKEQCDPKIQAITTRLEATQEQYENLKKVALDFCLNSRSATGIFLKPETKAFIEREGQNVQSPTLRFAYLVTVKGLAEDSTQIKEDDYYNFFPGVTPNP